MMSDNLGLPSAEELAKLPKASIAVYALRCALRVQPVWVDLKEPTAEYKKYIFDLNNFYRIIAYDTKVASEVVNFVKTKATAAIATSDTMDFAPNALYVAIAAIEAIDVSTPDAAATTATNAASLAANVCGLGVATNPAAYIPYDASITSANEDYAWLKEHKDEVTDASETGPLGDLWHRSPPDWYITVKEKYDKTIAEWERELESLEERARRYEESDPAPLISVYFDDSDFTKEEMAAFLEYVSESYRSLGGEGLKVVDGKTLLPENAKVVL
jgi:hypothetical protein